MQYEDFFFYNSGMALKMECLAWSQVQIFFKIRLMAIKLSHLTGT